jgi:hypothetical protein
MEVPTVKQFPKRRTEDVVFRELAGEVFLIPVRGRLADLQDLFMLDETGAYLWARLDGSRSVDDLAHELSAEFEVEPDAAYADVVAFLAELEEASLLTGSPNPEG